MAQRFAYLVRLCAYREWVNPRLVARAWGCHPRTPMRMLEALEREGFNVPKWRSLEES